MKLFKLIIAGFLFALPAIAKLDCDCASCRAKAASGKEFTLPSLQGLEGTAPLSVEPTNQTVEVEDDCSDCDHDHAEVHRHAQTSVPHDHDGDGISDHAIHNEHTGHDHAVPHDHDGVSDHDSHEDHSGHDHGAHDDHVAHDTEGIELSPDMIKKIGIQVVEAKSGSVSMTTVFPAEIKLNRDQTASVSPRYASIIRKVNAEVGDVVSKGDVLATLENRETMAVYTLAAPQDGIIITKDLAVGEIAAEDRVLFEVADLSSVWADISIFPKFQHLVRKGMSVDFIAHDGHSAKGLVKYVSPIVSHETRTFTARCVLEGADEDFTPGAFVRARINLETAEIPVCVEREAVQMIEGNPVLFVPGDQGFIARDVQLGLADEISVEIKHGLKPGEPYVAIGAFALKAQIVISGIDPHAGHGH